MSFQRQIMKREFCMEAKLLTMFLLEPESYKGSQLEIESSDRIFHFKELANQVQDWRMHGKSLVFKKNFKKEEDEFLSINRLRSVSNPSSSDSKLNIFSRIGLTSFIKEYLWYIVADQDPQNPYNFPGIGSVSKVGLDPEYGSVSNDTDPDQTKTIENRR